MAEILILVFCVLLLLAYVFDITVSKTKIPSVILLLLTGWLAQQLTDYYGIEIPKMDRLLPAVGTIGLIFIVLDSSLELELKREKKNLIIKTSAIALIPMILFCIGLACVFSYYGKISFYSGMINAIPFGIISSAIAIPSAQNLEKKFREFVTFESSFSDIFGIVFFNFILLNSVITWKSIGNFSIQLLLMFIISFVATVLLSLLLNNIRYKVKFIPILLFTIIIYIASESYHLPSLIFILIFGLFLGNISKLRFFRFTRENKLMKKISSLKLTSISNLSDETNRFKNLITELTFLIRAVFFLLFGYLINTSELTNTKTLLPAFSICISFFIIRYLCLLVLKIKITPLLYYAPRGLITILLFLAIPPSLIADVSNKSLVIQTIIISTILMVIEPLISGKSSSML